MFAFPNNKLSPEIVWTDNSWIIVVVDFVIAGMYE
jgi:hypothetical protein